MSTFPEPILLQHIAVLGKTGSGKTSTAKLLVEQVAASNARVCVIDPIKSDWWGLTSSSDGKREGLPFYVLGGPRAHVPLHAAAGKALGEIVATGKLRLSILDLADFDLGEHAKFFVDFAASLFRHAEGVVYLVIEEAHIFAPKERAGFGDEAKSTHWMNKLATGSRSKGIRLIVCTQRTQALHNAVLGSCETMVAHRLTLPADQKPVLEWLRANTDAENTKRIAESLSSLKPGEGWICSGEAQIVERRQFPKIKTFDNSKTPTDDSSRVHVKTAAVDESNLRAIIGTAVDEAKANDPRELKRRIAELTKKLDAAPAKAAPDPKAAERAAAAMEKVWRDVMHARDATIQSLRARLKRITDIAANDKDAPLPPPPKHAQPFVADNLPTRPVPERRTANAATSNSSSTIGKGERAILIAIAQHGGCTRAQLTVLTGYKRSSRDTYLQRLRQAGFVDGGERIIATDAGLAALGDFERLPEGAALREWWRGRLPEGERVILEVLCEAHPDGVTRESLSEATGYKRSSRDTYLQRLNAKRLIHTNGKLVHASEQLFD